MFTKIEKRKIIILLLFLTLFTRSGAYGQLTESRPQTETEQSDHRPRAGAMPAAPGNGVYGRLMELIALIPSSGKTVSSAPDRSGGRNLFMPLIMGRTTENTVNDAYSARKATGTKVEARPVIRLTATFTATGLRRARPTVIIEENGVSRFVSVGGTIAGMTVVEIQRGKVILNRGDRKCVMTLGLLSEETAAKDP